MLIYPPFADPTWPYVSLPTLKGYLGRRGIPVTVRDLNVEAFSVLTAESTTDEWQQRLSARFQVLNGRESLTLSEQMEYRRVAEALPLFQDFAALMTVMRDERSFYDRAAYGAGRDGIEDLFRIMEAVYFPFRFNCNRADHLVAPWDFTLLDSYITHRRSLLDRFYRQQLAELEPPRFVGISLTFVSQIPEAFYLCRLLRDAFPCCFLMLGGPCLDLMVRYGRPEVVSLILDHVDAITMQEGEKALEQLLPLLADGLPDQEQLAAIPNLITRDKVSGVVHQGPPWVLDLVKSVAPDYSDLDLKLYLAPSPMLLYSPTRGCYWNKCSFCGYGFNQSGAHAYREIPVQQAVADLQALQEEFGVANFYLSCDVLSPDYAFRLAQEILDSGLEIYWSTDLRIEAAYTPERCRLLYLSGLRAVAFGVESCSQAVLRLMHKGTTPERIRSVNRHFHQAGISTAWMTFLGHPGEGFKEAKATLDLLTVERKVVDQFIVGTFGLTPGSRIACRPEEFGIDSIYFTAGDVFRLFPLYTVRAAGTIITDRQSAQLDAQIDDLSSRYQLDHYPWAGAISTHHSFLYLLRYGQRVFAKAWPLPAKRKMKAGSGKKIRPRFPLAELRRREEQFMGQYLEGALQLDPETGLTPLCFDHFQEALAREGGGNKR
ncbi:MAG: radical SAM protein [Proteobacteria bacterium]|nr:radical SAM protein [Pseudomonadota bacterium]MBU1648167.1 radical SAM protein [Pseudomonadota bacterium]MBU1986167.1 radical SAM protein [Pseudomonadota bacterium]